MAENGDAGSTDKPEDGGQGRGNETKGNRDNKKSSVELGGGEDGESEVQVVALEHSNAVHANNDKDNDEEKQSICEKAVDGKESKDDGVVGGEVAEIEVDSGLSLAPALRLGHALDIEEVCQGFEIGESALQSASFGLKNQRNVSCHVI